MKNNWTLFKLETNYRSGYQICVKAQNLIEHNQGRVAKRTTADRTGGTVTMYRCETPGEEMAFVLQQILQEVGVSHMVESPKEWGRHFAVLARTNRLADAFAQHLSANGVPVRRAKQRAMPMDWKRTKLLLTVLDNPWNDTAVLQLVKLDKGAAEADRTKSDAQVAMRGVNELLGFQFGKGGGLAADLDLVRHGVGPESRERVHDACRELGKRGEWTVPDLLLYLQAKDNTAEEEGEGVTVTTMHSAKGREWRHVFVVGCEEGTVPSGRKDADVEEERRLMFVAMTRAADTLALTWCAARPQNRGPNLPSGPMEPKQPSRFIAEAGL